MEGEVAAIVTRTRHHGDGDDCEAEQDLVLRRPGRRAHHAGHLRVARGRRARRSRGTRSSCGCNEWTDEHLNPEGEISEVLGIAGDARVEVLSVARSFGLPPAFPADVEREAAALPGAIAPADLRGRVDCRRRTVVTIDPEDAKDFDDAAFDRTARRTATVRLGVHIADVSHYVREGTLLDREAYARGTSVYMVNEVIPMLPERLSNDLCSLRPDVDRLTYSVFMDVNARRRRCRLRNRQERHSQRAPVYVRGSAEDPGGRDGRACGCRFSRFSRSRRSC